MNHKLWERGRRAVQMVGGTYAARRSKELCPSFRLPRLYENQDVKLLRIFTTLNTYGTCSLIQGSQILMSEPVVHRVSHRALGPVGFLSEMRLGPFSLWARGAFRKPSEMRGSWRG